MSKPSGLTDYKFFFNGESKYCQVITDSRTDEKIDFYDKDWRRQCFTGLALPHKKHNYYIKKPYYLYITYKNNSYKGNKNIKYTI